MVSDDYCFDENGGPRVAQAHCGEEGSGEGEVGIKVHRLWRKYREYHA